MRPLNLPFSSYPDSNSKEARPASANCAVGRHGPLAIFSGDPMCCVGPDQDDWEDVLNPMMHRAFGYGALYTVLHRLSWASRWLAGRKDRKASHGN